MDVDLANAKEIFLSALEKGDDGEQQEFLERACGVDLELRRHVELLLEAHKQTGAFFEQGARAGATVASPPEDKSGTTVGPYKLLQRLGEGGMGDVYMAEQSKPVKRLAALKIIKPGMDSRQVIARFEAERQALAMMDHPNIARVLDAGTSDDGRPYFVMELVKGTPITQYCDSARFTTRQRLELFLAVCAGVQHAHQKGVIHRDLKPSNVLAAQFDNHVVPKIIDFGLAKALNQELTERTLFTQFGQILGTLSYMSPEQAKLNQMDVDTRSDVYSLGVLLYELLTGTTPIDEERLRSSGFDEVLRAIREEDPPTPSTRLSSSRTLANLADRRSVEPKRLIRLLHGDLDWIAMKSMSKERNERYQTADALAADIQRYLDDRPIEARRPSVITRGRRFLRRNKTPAALISLALLAGAMGVAAYMGRLQRTALAALAEQERWARNRMPTIKRLVADGHVVDAFREALEVDQVLADDPAFRELWDSFTVASAMEVAPHGAKVFIRDWDSDDDRWLEVGEAPLTRVVLPDGELRFRIAKSGYIAREFQRSARWKGSVSLAEDWGVPDDMVFIEDVRADGTNGLPADLGEYLIDRFEVTNAQFQEFVDAGGYEKAEYWEELEFVREGKELAWQEAVKDFHVRSSDEHGPAAWETGRYPAGQGDYPVSGVSWYEAVAFAKFAGKSLPTIHHWRWPALLEELPWRIVNLSNFSAYGLKPVGSNQGIGRYDVYDTAGNVKEWCINAAEDGGRCLLGGAWNESRYRFFDVYVASPWDRNAAHGFRCVRYLKNTQPAVAALDPWRRPFPDFAEFERKELDTFKAWYHVDPVEDRPLGVDRVESEMKLPDGIRHEVVRVASDYNERFNIHLFQPTDEQEKKYETIVYVPDGSAWFARKIGEGDNFDDLVRRMVRTGRMVCWPIIKGTYERRLDEMTIPPPPTIQTRTMFIAADKDISRTLEYLRTRPDVNAERVIYLGYSAGALHGPRALAMYPGFRAAVLVDGGYPPQGPTPEREIYHPFHFTPGVEIPVLMINGRYDPNFPYEASQLPFFNDLGTTVKKHILLDNAHGQAPATVVQEGVKWLRDVVGPD